MVVPIWPSTSRLEKINDPIVAARPARGGDHRTGAGHGPDQPGVQPGVNLLLEAGDHEQVVVRADREQQDHCQRKDDPIQFDAEKPLPHQDRKSD